MSEEIKILLLLLEKSEQILSLVNLPDSTIRKYNELKELTCKKLNIDYFPLEKSLSQLKPLNPSSSKYLNQIRDINSKKNIVIDFYNNLIENFLTNPNANFTNLEYNVSMLLKQLEITTKEIILNEDLEFDFKLEEIKLKEQIGKAETNSKRLSLILKEEQFKQGNYNSLLNV